MQGIQAVRFNITDVYGHLRRQDHVRPEEDMRRLASAIRPFISHIHSAILSNQVLDSKAFVSEIKLVIIEQLMLLEDEEKSLLINLIAEQFNSNISDPILSSNLDQTQQKSLKLAIFSAFQALNISDQLELNTQDLFSSYKELYLNPTTQGIAQECFDKVEADKKQDFVTLCLNHNILTVVHPYIHTIPKAHWTVFIKDILDGISCFSEDFLQIDTLIMSITETYNLKQPAHVRRVIDAFETLPPENKRFNQFLQFLIRPYNEPVIEVAAEMREAEGAEGFNVHFGSRDARTVDAVLKLENVVSEHIAADASDEAESVQAAFRHLMEKFDSWALEFPGKAPRVRKAFGLEACPGFQPLLQLGEPIKGHHFTLNGYDMNGMVLLSRLQVFIENFEREGVYSCQSDDQKNTAYHDLFSALDDCLNDYGSLVCNQGKTQRLVVSVLQGRLEDVDIDQFVVSQADAGVNVLSPSQAIDQFFLSEENRDYNWHTLLVKAKKFIMQNPLVEARSFYEELFKFAQLSIPDVGEPAEDGELSNFPESLRAATEEGRFDDLMIKTYINYICANLTEDNTVNNYLFKLFDWITDEEMPGFRRRDIYTSKLFETILSIDSSKLEDAFKVLEIVYDQASPDFEESVNFLLNHQDKLSDLVKAYNILFDKIGEDNTADILAILLSFEKPGAEYLAKNACILAEGEDSDNQIILLDFLVQVPSMQWPTLANAGNILTDDLQEGEDKCLYLEVLLKVEPQNRLTFANKIAPVIDGYSIEDALIILNILSKSPVSNYDQSIEDIIAFFQLRSKVDIAYEEQTSRQLVDMNLNKFVDRNSYETLRELNLLSEILTVDELSLLLHSMANMPTHHEELPEILQSIREQKVADDQNQCHLISMAFQLSNLYPKSSSIVLKFAIENGGIYETISTKLEGNAEELRSNLFFYSNLIDSAKNELTLNLLLQNNAETGLRLMNMLNQIANNLSPDQVRSITAILSNLTLAQQEEYIGNLALFSVNLEPKETVYMSNFLIRLSNPRALDLIRQTLFGLSAREKINFLSLSENLLWGEGRACTATEESYLNFILNQPSSKRLSVLSLFRKLNASNAISRKVVQVLNVSVTANFHVLALQMLYKLPKEAQHAFLKAIYNAKPKQFSPYREEQFLMSLYTLMKTDKEPKIAKVLKLALSTNMSKGSSFYKVGSSVILKLSTHLTRH